MATPACSPPPRQCSATISPRSRKAIIVKLPGEGRIFPWHQDGTTHWDSPDWHMHSHGFNFMPQVYGSTAANGVWVVPGTHASGHADIRALADAAGSERLAGRRSADLQGPAMSS